MRGSALWNTPTGRPGPKLAWHMVLLVVLKIAVLLLIYVVCFRPFGHPDAGPDAIGSRFAPTSRTQ
jgi:hypothetical protein